MKTTAILETTIVMHSEYTICIYIKPICDKILHKHGFFFYNAKTMHSEEETKKFLTELEEAFKYVINLTIEDVKKSIDILNDIYTRDLKYEPLLRYPIRKRR